jgi:hypothetical protein
LLYYQLTRLARSGGASETVQELAARVGMSERSTFRAVGLLRQLGVVASTDPAVTPRVLSVRLSTPDAKLVLVLKAISAGRIAIDATIPRISNPVSGTVWDQSQAYFSTATHGSTKAYTATHGSDLLPPMAVRKRTLPPMAVAGTALSTDTATVYPSGEISGAPVSADFEKTDPIYIKSRDTEDKSRDTASTLKGISKYVAIETGLYDPEKWTPLFTTQGICKTTFDPTLDPLRPAVEAVAAKVNELWGSPSRVVKKNGKPNGAYSAIHRMLRETDFTPERISVGLEHLKTAPAWSYWSSFTCENLFNKWSHIEAWVAQAEGTMKTPEGPRDKRINPNYWPHLEPQRGEKVVYTEFDETW